MMRRLCMVVCVVLCADTASAQYGLYNWYDSDEVRVMKDINQSLQDIRQEYSLMRISGDYDSLGGGGYVVVHPYYVYPTPHQWKHYYRAQRGEAKRAKLAAFRVAWKEAHK